MLNKHSFQGITQQGDNDRLRCCRDCTMKEILLLCHGCKNILEKNAFSPSEWEGDTQKPRRCRSCTENPKQLLCHGCEKYLSRQSFRKAAWKGAEEKVRHCSSCNERRKKRLCHGCENYLSKQSFSKAAWKGAEEKVRRCSSCNESRQKRLCHGCENYLSKQSFSKAAWKGAEEKVRHCSSCNESRQQRLCHETCQESCEERHQERLCRGCGRRMKTKSFTKGAWEGGNDKIRYCCSCTERRRHLIWGGSGTVLHKESSCIGVEAGHEEKVQLNCTDRHSMLCHQCEQLIDKDSISESVLKVDGQKIRLCLCCAEIYQPRPCIGCTKILSRESLGDGVEEGESHSGPFCLCCTTTYTVGERQELNSRQQYGKVKRASAAEARQWLSMRRCRGNEGQKSVVLRWPSSSISTADEIAMKERIIVRGQYARPTKTESDHLANYIRESSSAMTLQQARSLRRQILKQKAIAGYADLRRNASQLVSLYNSGTSIVALSQRFDAPPLNVLRVIMKQTGYDNLQIKKAFQRPESFFEARGLQEFKDAAEADSVTPVDFTATAKDATHFEDFVAAYLRDKGILFVHETQLAQEQTDILGEVFMTPDFLILDDLEINGKKVRWIDAKAYGTVKSEILIKRSRQQMQRYIGQWGPGAIVFKNGFGEGVSTALKDCAILNAHDFLPQEQFLSAE
eukprot:scaffold24373_cov122-Cylindrotheca_fusiformis.AAC.1